MRTLGYFGIIESLLTHKPDLKDPSDSIGRQIRGKMNLLNSRFKRPLPYSELLGDLPSDDIWKALYEFRSCAAHGTKPNFSKGLLSKLKTADYAMRLTRLAAVATMRHALDEPRLVRDLKLC